MSFEGKNLYGQYIDYSEKKKWPKGFICPYTGTIFYNICIYSRSQVSVYRTIGPLVLIVAGKVVRKIEFFLKNQNSKKSIMF